MSDRKPVTRREWIAGCSTALGASIAGCLGGGDGDGQSGESGDGTGTKSGGDSGETGADDGGGDDGGGDDEEVTPTPEFDAVATAGGSWPMYGQNPQNSAATTDYSGPDADCTKAWIRDLPDSGGPILADGRLYIRKGNGKFIEAIDPKNGETLWETELKYEQFSPLVFYDGLVYTYDGPLVGLDPETAEKVFEIETVYGELLPQDGVMYIVTGDGTLAAIDLESEEERWRTENVEDTNWGSAVSADGTLVVPGKNAVRAFETETGETVWTKSFDERIPRYVSIADGVAYFTHEEGGEVVAAEALRVADGESVWTREDEGLAGPLTLGHGNVYAGRLEEPGVLALDAESGDELSEWSTEVDAITTYVTDLMPRVQLAGDTLYAWRGVSFADSELHCIDAHSGETQWKSRQYHSEPPLIGDGSVFFGEMYEGRRLMALTPP
ncbi:PQQ-binding-like beta-propeller repeat protein [Halosimplex sp. J119]